MAGEEWRVLEVDGAVGKTLCLLRFRKEKGEYVLAVTPSNLAAVSVVLLRNEVTKQLEALNKPFLHREGGVYVEASTTPARKRKVIA